MRKRVFFIKVLVLGFVFVMTSSFVKKDIDKFGKKVIDESQSMTFNTDGLYYAEFFDYMFRGHIENIEINRKDMEFLMIFEQYLRAFGKQCPTYLPANKVEIMEQICVAEEITRNGYGMEIGRVCVEWKWVGTGLYARPELYNAKMEVEGIQRAESLRTVMAMITNPNAMGNSMDMVHKINGLKNDMAQIFKLNPCNSTGIKRFEENLRLFALNKPAIRMQGSSKYEVMKKSGGPTGLQNFNKLVDDLVADQSETWAFNRYVSESISGLTILSKDNEGRPTALKANYKFKGFGNGNNGLVKVTFKKGLPDCIYFADFPNNCKTPNSSIVASYAQGNYRKD